MVLKKVSGTAQMLANTGYGDDLQYSMALFSGPGPLDESVIRDTSAGLDTCSS
jgi:hypothetical protein